MLLWKRRAQRGQQPLQRRFANASAATQLRVRVRVALLEPERRSTLYDVVDSGFITGGRTFNATPRAEVTALGDALPAAVANLVDNVDAPQRLLCTGSDGVAAVRLAEAARASTVTGERVFL